MSGRSEHLQPLMEMFGAPELRSSDVAFNNHSACLRRPRRRGQASRCGSYTTFLPGNLCIQHILA